MTREQRLQIWQTMKIAINIARKETAQKFRRLAEAKVLATVELDDAPLTEWQKGIMLDIQKSTSDKRTQTIKR